MHVILASFQLTWKDSFYFVYEILFLLFSFKFKSNVLELFFTS